MDSFVSSVPLLVACTILPAPHAVYALQFVVHRHGSDRAAIEADSFEHAAIKTHELGLYPAQVTRKESKEFSAEDQLGRNPAHGEFAVVLSVSKAFMIISLVHLLCATGPGFPDGYRARYAASGK